MAELDLDFGAPLPGQSDISEARWERARENVDILELVTDMTGSKPRGAAICCPFGHGVGARDSRPSFYIYPSSNSCFCFGCPPGENFYDPVGFVARMMELPPHKALLWLEKHYDLPPLQEEPPPEPEAEEEEPQGPTRWLIGVGDLKDPFFKRVRSNLRSNPDPTSARIYMAIYWESVDTEDPTRMAQVVGRDKVQQLIGRVNGGRARRSARA